MTKATTILENIRILKNQKEAEFQSFTGDMAWEKRAPLFEPITDKEALAWRVGFLRGIQEAELLVSDFLYPTIDTDHDE